MNNIFKSFLEIVGISLTIFITLLLVNDGTFKINTRYIFLCLLGGVIGMIITKAIKYFTSRKG